MFSPLDDTRPVVPGQLPDLAYLDKPSLATDLQSLVAQLPYRGPGWYSRPALEWLLHTEKAHWSDLKLGITASAKIDGDRFRSAMDHLQKAFEDTDLPGDDSFKRAVNAWIGLCAITKRTTVKSLCSADIRDLDTLSGEVTELGNR